MIGSPHGLIYEEDGSVIIHISRNSPGVDREANWLPSGEGKFVLCSITRNPVACDLLMYAYKTLRRLIGLL